MPSKRDRLAARGRPKRRAAAKTHFFKYQLATNPSRAEENDLKRALQESLEEQHHNHHHNQNFQQQKQQQQQQQQHVNGRRGLANGKRSGNNNINNNNIIIISSTNSSDVSKISSSSNESVKSVTSATTTTTNSLKRTRSGASFLDSDLPVNKRAKLNVTNGHQAKCDGNQNIVQGQSISPPTTPTRVQPNDLATLSLYNTNRAIKTYSKSQPQTPVAQDQQQQQHQRQFNNIASSSDGPKSSTPIKKPTFESPNLKDKVTETKNPSVSRSTQTPSVSSKFNSIISTSDSKDNDVNNSRSQIVEVKGDSLQTATTPPVQDQYLKFKRESKNYAYVKMTALKVSTSKSPSSYYNKSSNSKKSSPNDILHNNSANKTPSKATNNSGLNGSNCSKTSSAKQNGTSTTSGGSLMKIDPKHDSNNKMADGKKSPNCISLKSASHNGKPSDNSKIAAPKSSKHMQASQAGKNNIPKQDTDVQAGNKGPRNDCSLNDTIDLSKKNQNQAGVKVTKKRLPQGSWSLLGVPEEKVIYLRDDESPKRLICYPAIKHIEGDVIQVRDSVLLRSGARKTDLPYIAKVCAFWEDAETGGVMMSLFWYYRPEHTEEGRRPHHLPDEIFASRHRDVDSVECIEDKCYVLTFNEYCRYRKRCKMEQVNTTWSLADVTIPVSNESYPRRNRIPDSDVNPELVFCCRQIYDSRMRRLVKNPLINPKYGHI